MEQRVAIVEERNLSHEQRDGSFQTSLQKLIDKVKERGDLPHISVEKQLELIDSLSQFDFGRFLIERRGGLNGLWTHYAITHPLKGGITGLNNRGNPFNEMERFLLNRAPVALATQQRFLIFKTEIQKRVSEECNFASIPSGVMADLLDLDYSKVSHFTLYGIDLDSDSIDLAFALAKEKGVSAHCKFSCKDAWNLEVKEQFHLITSNGLTIYEADDEKVVELYHQFYRALKPEGCLITSFLTPPPIPGVSSEWDFKKINSQDALLQKIIFSDIFESRWQIFRSGERVKKQLQAAGFNGIEIIYDDAHIFPTVIATKARGNTISEK